VPGHPEIFVIGDTAQVDGPRGPLPGVAPVAKQQGAYVARVMRRGLLAGPRRRRSAIAITAIWQRSGAGRLSPISVG
jgi:NADH dehydrogenase